jgi:putative ABC transport system permease protein
MIAALRRFASRHHVLLGVWEAMGMGLQGIRAYKMRAFLTILGVVMGIMTVTGMSSIVAGLNASMARQIATLGSSTIFIRPFRLGEHPSDEDIRKAKGVTLDEAALIAARPAVESIAPLQIIFAESVKYGPERARDITLLGTTEAYEEVHDTFVSRGRFISRLDVSRGTKVVVLGADIVDALFPYLDPIDKIITIDGRRFRVVGVLERKGKFLWQSLDNLVLVPVNSLEKKNQRFNFMVADLKLHDLRPGHPDRDLPADHRGDLPGDDRHLLDRSPRRRGGRHEHHARVGHRAEIGIRKALGATKRDILWQFLTEAMTLTGTGGLIGIVIGGGAAFLINTFSPFPAVIQPTWVTIAFGTAIAVGLTFGLGLWPAAKAAGLDPIEALRYE